MRVISMSELRYAENSLHYARNNYIKTIGKLGFGYQTNFKAANHMPVVRGLRHKFNNLLAIWNRQAIK